MLHCTFNNHKGRLYAVFAASVGIVAIAVLVAKVTGSSLSGITSILTRILQTDSIDL
ncbi:hypothetical protein DPMN_038797 [Dreissena polymorpha]|uniref:Uncharacterized protein n=1 Tax=Dreissena polymorpha TaxID=45954 RepID=A0A9D4MH11_DREPO|nr:hypothetical protein DPMN_038797 [Dreissena polymorpha]